MISSIWIWGKTKLLNFWCPMTQFGNGYRTYHLHCPKNNFSSQHLKSFWRIFEASNFQSASIKQCKISWRWLMIIGATLCMCGILMDSHNPIDCESSTKTCWDTTEAQTQSKKPGLGMPRAPRTPWKSMECGGFQSPFRTSLDDRGHKNADRLDDLDDLRFYLDD